MIDFEDDLDAILNAPPIVANTEIRETCGKCSGTGIWTGYGDWTGDRRCTLCKGVGYRVFKFTKSERDARRQKAVARAERKQQQTLEAFAKENPLVWQWMNEQANRFEFAKSMLEAVKKWGKLTEKQLAAATKCAVGSAERKAKWEADRVVAKAQAKEVTVEAIEVAFKAARDAGIKWPRLRLDTFIFSPAGANSANAGAVYIKEGETYLGKVLNGKLFRSRDCSAEQEQRIVDAAHDPKSAAIAYGKKFGSRSACGRELSNQESIDLGIGPVCAGKFGWGE